MLELIMLYELILANMILVSMSFLDTGRGILMDFGFNYASVCSVVFFKKAMPVTWGCSAGL